jgi:hypothetical protein
MFLAVFVVGPNNYIHCNTFTASENKKWARTDIICPLHIHIGGGVVMLAALAWQGKEVFHLTFVVQRYSKHCNTAEPLR